MEKIKTILKNNKKSIIYKVKDYDWKFFVQNFNSNWNASFNFPNKFYKNIKSAKKYAEKFINF